MGLCVVLCLFFCLVGVRLKRDTLRLLPLETCLERELVLERDYQLGKLNNIGIVLVYSFDVDVVVFSYITYLEIVN